MPILDRMLDEQEAALRKARETGDPDDELHWTPSAITRRLGLEINHPDSVLYWAARNDIPVFCPALTDGSLGDMLYFHTYRAAPRRLRVDIVDDVRRINTLAVRAKRAGMIILGGGLVKHHIANACLMRNGAESAVYINTAQEFDGSDAGARPDEAVSWGKIKADADSVKVSLLPTPFYRTSLTATGLRGCHRRLPPHRGLDVRAGRPERGAVCAAAWAGAELGRVDTMSATVVYACRKSTWATVGRERHRPPWIDAACRGDTLDVLL